MELKIHKAESGKAAGKVDVADAVFAGSYNEPLIHQVVTAYLAGGRSGTKAQKSRSDARGGGDKPWRQKGMGRARAGSIRSPLWRGGGKTFAARPRDYSQKVNRKMYRGALRSILSELIRSERLVVVDGFELDEPRTKGLLDRLAALKLRNVMIITKDLSQNLFLAARNVPDVGLCDVTAVDPVALLAHDTVVITQDALKVLEESLQ